ncbi:MAG: hypothetical protein OXF02_07455 [Simkaniaceae bacterium]|nr:hypothetical protein [Simkaniaceae bacterium]
MFINYRKIAEELKDEVEDIVEEHEVDPLVVSAIFVLCMGDRMMEYPLSVAEPALTYFYDMMMGEYPCFITDSKEIHKTDRLLTWYGGVMWRHIHSVDLPVRQAVTADCTRMVSKKLAREPEPPPRL